MQHFRDANRQLYEAIQANPNLEKNFPPDVVAHVQSGLRGGFKETSPPSQTLYYNAQDPSKIKLVP